MDSLFLLKKLASIQQFFAYLLKNIKTKPLTDYLLPDCVLNRAFDNFGQSYLPPYSMQKRDRRPFLLEYRFWFCLHHARLHIAGS